MDETQGRLELVEVSKYYGNFKAVDNFSLKVPGGSFTTLLGPSGCGKTTLLRIMAGFFEPDSGGVFIAGEDQRGIAPENRKTGIVFQDYALFPHMNAEENLAYGLTIRRLDRAFINKTVAETAEKLGLERLLKRYPNELSGGQQQRLALGRALILEPQVLLMDEPLSSLDAKLRLAVREELKDIQKSLGVTTIYVTHDQEEALSLSDYIAVMLDGHLEQYGTPREVYNRPRSVFAADFSGPANFIGKNGKKLMIRPEWMSLADRSGGSPVSTAFTLCGALVSAGFLGRVVRLRIAPEPGSGVSGGLIAELPAAEERKFETGMKIELFVHKFWEIPE
jgi:ABC-type Fe3+/spermidine/putrescine transport system ATPase subunit